MEAKELFPECASGDKKHGVVRSRQATLLSNTLSIAITIFLSLFSLFFRKYNFMIIKKKLSP